MKSFEITNEKDLSELEVDKILVKKISSDKQENLSNLRMGITQNGSSKPFIPLRSTDQKTEIITNEEIKNCSVSKLVIDNPKNTKFIVHYE
jgi:hypothetical protein